MGDTPQDVPQEAIRGTASGVLFMAFFGTLWASIGAGGLQGWGEPWVAVAVPLIGVVLFVGGVLLWRESRRLPDEVASAAGDDRHEGLWFGVIFGLEGASIAVASVVCNAVGRLDLFFPIMALIVGLHFFPLAWLFRQRAHYLAGALLCLVGFVTLVAVPVSATLGGRQILARSLGVGFGCAAILWGTGLLFWVRGARMLRDYRALHPA